MQSFKGQAAASVHRLNQITRISYTIFICESKTNLNKCYKIDMATDDVTMNALLESVAKYFNVAEFTKLLLTFIFLFWAQLSLNHFTIIVSLENTDNDSEWIKDFDPKKLYQLISEAT